MAAMHFDKHGSGPPVVLIHGLGAYSFSWRDTVAALTGHFTTYAVDLLGFGESAAPSGFPNTAEAQARAVRDFMKAEGLSNPIIIGHSMGGAVCLYLATLAGAPSLSKMILIDAVASPQPEGENIAKLSEAIKLPGFDAPTVGRQLAAAALALAYKDGSLITPTQVAGYAKGLSSREQIQAFINHSSNLKEISFSKETLGKIATKTLVIWGKQDRLPFDSGETLAKLLGNASFRLIENCGHIPHEEQPKETNDLIANFLK